MTAPTTSVKTTRVNIASVTPVRKRFLSGYAIAICRTGARARIRPTVAGQPAEQEVGVVDDRPAAPSTTMIPPRIQTAKSIVSSVPASVSTVQNGRSHRTTSASRRP